MKHPRSTGSRPLVASILSFLTGFLPMQAEQVIFTEIQYNAKAGQPDFLEITNNTATIFDIGKWYFSDGISYEFPDFNSGDTDAHLLKQFETILVSPVDEATLRAAYPNIPETTRIFGPYTSSLSNSGERVTLNDKNGVVMTTVEYNDGGKWPGAADGTGHTLTRINRNLREGGWRNWASSPTPGGTPGFVPAPDALPTTTTQIVSTDAVWKYDQNEANNDLGTAWRDPDFNDAGWSEGPGIFGVDGGDSFGTSWTTGGRYTYYLRKEFQFDSGFTSATMDVSAHLDDGMVIYLNGQEVARFNMTTGTINFDTAANGSSEWDALQEIATDVDITGSLQTGRNVLAVEVHNRTQGSGDIAFGADISITNTAAPAASLTLSEVHFGDDGNVDWIELHAPGSTEVDASSFKISDSRKLTNQIDLVGLIPAGGYLSFPVTIVPDDNGDVDLFLVRGDTVVDTARLDRDRGEETFQSYPVGEEWFGGPGHTQDAPNNPIARQTAIVINEIMYDAPSDQGTGEFIELYNRGSETVDLSGWRISDGVRFDFPAGTTLDAGDYLVIAADADCINSSYPGISAIGNWSGGLRDRGELLRIEDANGNLVDEVDYQPEGDWPNLADGDGSSMELRHPDMDNNNASAWEDSDESNKSTMQTFTYTGEFVRSKWLPVTSGQELHTHLVGDAHVILEDISISLEGSEDNLLRNPGIMSPNNLSSGGWVTQGTHWQSFMDAGKLNLISTGHGDNKANRGEVDFATNPIVGQTYTLSFKGRWVSGKSRVIFQTLDHGYGTSFLLPIPENLGTPGAPNSSATATAAPTVEEVIHSPAVPQPGQSVTVSAQITSAATLDSVELVHRLDNASGSGTWLRTPMIDDGTGLYRATVNQHTSDGNVTQFYVEANAGGVTTTQPKYGADRPAMWIVDDQVVPTQLLRERFIISQYDRQALTTSVGSGPAFDYNFPRMSNQFFNATFIANESEIYYNAEIRKSGSPFTRSTNANIDHGKWKLPGDRLFRGRRRSVIDASGTPEGSGTPRFYDDRIARYFLYQLGHPVNEMEYTYTIVNNLPFKRRESHEPISNDFLNRNFSDGSKGTLLRIDDEWRFTNDDGNTRSSRNADWSYKDSENPIAYHSEWLLRSREADYDYGNFIELTRRIRNNQTDEASMRRITNVDMLALNAVVRGYDADWDTITLDRGKNGYFFRPKDGGGWMLLHWDGDRVFDRSNQQILGNLTGVRSYFNLPFVRQKMNYYMTKLLNEHTKGSARTQAWMQAETNAVSGTGITMTSSHYTNWFNSRETIARNFVTNAVTNTNFAVTTPATPTAEDVITLNGTSPPTVYGIQIPGQSNTEFTWVSNTTWELSGVVLTEGANALDIQGVDHDGNIAEQVQFNITKTSNSAPVIVLDASPKSLNVALTETLMLDGAASYDPEGEVLTFDWEVTPEGGATLIPGERTLTANFTQPGFYLVSANVSDTSGNISTQTLGISVHSDNDFSNFGGDTLEDFWTGFKVDKHGNSSSTPYYTLEDHEGRLTINIPSGPVPLGLPEPELPPAVNYINFGQVWKYDQNTANVDRGTVWREPEFDDADWSEGPGRFGKERGGTFGTPWTTGGRITYYLRKEFEFNASPFNALMDIDAYVDDGCVIYLNGQEVTRINLPDGPINYDTPANASSEWDDLIEVGRGIDISSFIRPGTNVLAVEVHNRTSGGNDIAFDAKIDIAANPAGAGPPTLDEADYPWVRRSLPSGDWILQTDVKIEKTQFGEYFTGLLVEAKQAGNTVRYGLGFHNGESISALRINPSGTSEILSSATALGEDDAVIRLEKKGNLLNFHWLQDGEYTQVHQITLPEDTTFDLGGVFASTEVEQPLEASFDYVMLISSAADFTSWMIANGFDDPQAEYGNSGMTNLLAYALGRDLNPDVEPFITNVNGNIGFSYRHRIDGGQVSYRVERSSDMINWEPAGDLVPLDEPIENPDGTFTVNLTSDIPVTTRTEVFYRLVVSL
ncbi:MAG: lamin tail domain-containing protein [Akkermansiaceae bacterium]